MTSQPASQSASQSASKAQKIRLIVRPAKVADIPALAALSRKTYGDDQAVTEEMISGQIANFPEGQFVADYNGEVVGHCATFIISGEVALKPHTWMGITGQGFGSRHNPDGDYLYGMEVNVDERFRRLRIGQRLYDARKRLCVDLGLKGIVFGGRMPAYHRRGNQRLTPDEYIAEVQAGNVKDPVVRFHLRSGFEVMGFLKNYLPTDHESMGYATHMIWRNPSIEQGKWPKPALTHGHAPQSVRIASVQFQVRKVTSFDDFAHQVEYFVDVASDYRADFVTFPELFTIPLLSIEKQPLSPQKAMERISDYTGAYVSLMQRLAISYNINIIGGSHPTFTADGDLQNYAYVFLRDGQVHTQAKIHPTPSEAEWWNIKGGDSLRVIQTDCGPIGVLICYDAEFPELARHLTNQGAKILFVPFWTDERQGYMRVRYCSQARAVENQIYVVISGVVGNLPSVENMNVNYAQSGIFTPCDFPFARDGIAALAEANTESIIVADVRLDQLIISRNSGTVQNLKDRRFDLYHVVWKKQ